MNAEVPRGMQGPKPFDVQSVEMQSFIRFREIAPEDVELIERISRVNKGVIIQNLHNFFTGEREKSVDMMKRLLERAVTPEQKELYEAFLPFAEKYDYIVCHHLERTLEGLGK